MSYSIVGDTAVILKLSWQLYQKIYVAAREAPKNYNDLAAELRFMSNVVTRVQQHHERQGPLESDEMVTALLARSLRVLNQFSHKLAKYNILAESDSGNKFRRMQFAAEVSAIDGLKRKLRDLRRDLTDALELERLAPQSPSTRHAIDYDSDVEGAVGEPTSDICEKCSSQRSIRRTATYDTSPSARTLRGSITTTPTSGCLHQDISPGSYKSRRPTFASTGLRPSVSASSAQDCVCCNESIYDGNPFETEDDEHVLSSGDEESAGRLEKMPQPPLELDPKRKIHDAASSVQDRLQSSYQKKANDLTTESWIYISTWWLLKGRTIAKISNPDLIALQPTDSEWTSTVSDQQCHADLLKSSFILEEIILKSNLDSLDAHLVRMISNLARALSELFGKYRGDIWGVYYSEASILEQYLELYERPDQPIAEQALNDPLPSRRWIDVDRDNRGAEHEELIFQTFVDAQLGKKKAKDKSFDARYMLILWTCQGETGLFVSLCNQDGTINLARGLVAEDLEEYTKGKVQRTFLLPIDFPNQEAVIRFLTSADVDAFFELPKCYFVKMDEQAPTSEELPIYQSAIKTCIDRSLPTVYRPENNGSLKSGKYSSCALKLYESMHDNKCWKMTRRLVVSSSPEKIADLTCHSYWLPASQVRLSRQEAEVTINWSDCGNLIGNTGGAWDPKYSYVYDPDKSTRKIIIGFENSSDANHFEECLLFPTEIPAHAPGLPPQVKMLFRIERPSIFQDFRVYRMCDPDEYHEDYHAIVTAYKSPSNYHQSHVYFVYRDLDWEFNGDAPGNILIPSLSTADYESNMRGLLYQPNEKDPLPEFNRVVECPRTAQLTLGCSHNRTRYMHALTGWQVSFYRVATEVVIAEGRQLFPEKHKKVGVEVWKRYNPQTGQNMTQMAIRLNTHSTDRSRWVTASLSSNVDVKGGGSDLQLRDLQIKRGFLIDTTTMTAVMAGSARDDGLDRKRYKISMAFADPRSMAEFMASGLGDGA